MLWSYVFDEQALVTLFKEQVQGSLDYAEPLVFPSGITSSGDGIPRAFGAEGKNCSSSYWFRWCASVAPTREKWFCESLRVCYSCRALCRSSLLSEEHVKRCLYIASFWHGLKFAQRGNSCKGNLQ